MDNLLQLQADRASPFSVFLLNMVVLLFELPDLLLDCGQHHGMPGLYGSDCRLETFFRHRHFCWESRHAYVHSTLASSRRHHVPKASFVLRVVKEILHDFLCRLPFGPASPPLDRLERPWILSVGEPVLGPSTPKTVYVESVISAIHESSICGIFVQQSRHLNSREGLI